MKLRCNGSDIGWLQHREGHIITDSISCIQISIHIYLSYSLNLTVHLNSLSCQCSERVSSNYSCFSEVSQLFWPLMPSWWNVHILNPLTKSLCCSQRILKSTLPSSETRASDPIPRGILDINAFSRWSVTKGIFSTAEGAGVQDQPPQDVPHGM